MDRRTSRLPPGLVVFGLIALIAAVGFARLGFWQLERHTERRDANAERSARLAVTPAPLDSVLSSAPGGEQNDADGLEWRRVLVSGTWRPGSDVLVRNRALRGRPGVHVVTPMRLDDGAEILVLRGWLPASDATTPGSAVASPPSAAPDRFEAILRRSRDGHGAPVIGVPAGSDTLLSLAAIDVERIWSELGEAPADGNGRVTAYFLHALPDGADEGSPVEGIPARVPLPEVDSGPHLTYAVQWFSFALVALVGAFVFVRQRRREVSAASEGDRKSR